MPITKSYMPQYFGKLQTTEQPWSTIGSVESINKTDSLRDSCASRTIHFNCGETSLNISILAPNLIRVRMSPTGEFNNRSYSITVPDEEWEIIPFEVRETEEKIEIETAQILISVKRDRPAIECFDKSGKPFASDCDRNMGWRAGATAGWKRIEADEHFYGFGQRTGFLDKLSEVKTNWTTDSLDYNSLTDEMYQAIAFYIALNPDRAYGIFFNTTFWSQFDIGAEQPGVLRMETRGPELDYYIIYGPEPAQIIATYTQLTGRMPLPPKWALGYHQCRWSYESEDIVRELAKEFRDRAIPCDVIHLDIDYMRGYRVFTWSPKRFPDPAKLIADLKAAGFKVVTIVDPGVKYEPEADYEIFDRGVENDYFVRTAEGKLFHGYVWPDKAVFPDFMRPEVRQWWGELHKTLTDVGIAGIWNDMNEPAIAERPFGDGGEHICFPLDAPQGPESDRATHAETHNLYGLMMAKACAEGLQKVRSADRSFVLTRSGFAGIQRYSSVWMGDNQSQWEHLEMSLPMLCNMGLSGVAFVGCDIGGFAGNATAELFARWMQVGMLYPLMRGHSAMSTAQHEPWVFGDRTEKICREYINLRYQLLPYIYTLFWEAATTGTPILRPLLYHFPRDRTTYHLYDQVLLGPSLMAAPVYRPGVEHRAVYLPEGTWYDWWTGECYHGPMHILAYAPLERMPLYVRGGGIMALAPVRQFVSEEPLESLKMRIWPGSGEWTLYEDDGHSFEHEKGVWATTNYKVYLEGEKIIVEIAAREGQFLISEREVIVEVVGVGEQRFTDDGTVRRLTFG
ncbi:glycoside hydrolase family 31 protein [Microcoleus sp. BR0-C5]|uniref:glycoside hydrolase family 31 protein n=1 Tax=Microcoleus sp. BR0-C5 TaxID=2818713 RepID=UPI002FD0073B